MPFLAIEGGLIEFLLYKRLYSAIISLSEVDVRLRLLRYNSERNVYAACVVCYLKFKKADAHMLKM